MEAWEKELARELEELPDLEAPTTLIPNVMGRLTEEPRAAWYEKSWWQWPRAARAASALAALLFLGALGWLSGTFGHLDLWGELSVAWTEFQSALTLALNTLETVLGGAARFWREHGQLILLGSASILLATYLTCVAAGTALYRLAWRRYS
jgi:hypothetical protein